MQMITYRTFLHAELNQRRTRNPAYSIRAYARDLELSTTHLNDILREKSRLSPERALNVAEKLNLNPVDRETFLDLVAVECPEMDYNKSQAQKRLDAKFMELKFLDEASFTPISEWYYLPLLELLSLKEENQTPEYLGRRLGIETEIVQKALATLQQQQMITEENGRFVQNANYATSSETPSQVIRQAYRTTLKRAEEAIDQQSLSQRDFSVATLSLSKKKMPLLKERLMQFRRQLAQEFGQDPDKDAVYTLSICLFETTKDVQ